MYKASTGDKTFEIVVEDQGILIDGQLLSWNLMKISDREYHAIHHHKGYRIEIIDIDSKAKVVQLKINNRIYSISVKDRFDRLLEQMGLNAGAGQRVNAVKAPMPGLVVEVRVKVGDQVASGDALVILEAMKMENIIRSAGDGVIKKVHVATGEGVEKNQVLIEF